VRIDASNAEIINSKAVYIHDDVLENLTFNRERKELCLYITRNSSERKYSILYSGVIGFNMTSCDFWGSSPRILDFEKTGREESTIISKLFSIKKDNGFTDSLLESEESYIETVITFVSGDKLTVACKCIDID